MAYEVDYSFGVWVHAGNMYKASKPVVIEGQEFWVTVFNNQNSKTKENAPDLKIQLKKAEPRQSTF